MNGKFSGYAGFFLLFLGGTAGLWAQQESADSEAYQKGLFYWWKTEYDSSLHFFGVAREEAEASRDWVHYIRSSRMVAKSLNNLDQFEKAKSLFQKSLQEAPELLPADHPEVLNLRDHYGVFLRQRNHMKEAMAEHLAVLEIRQQKNSLDTALANSFEFLASDYHSLGHYKKALSYGEKCLEIRRAHLPANSMKIAIVANLMGLIEGEDWRIHRSIAYYQEALDIILAHQDSTNLNALIIMSNIGGNLISLKQYDEAFRYLRAPLPHLEGMPIDNQLMFLYGLGTAYNNLGDYEQALDFLLQTQTLLQNHEQAADLAYMDLWVAHELARIYLRKGDPAMALPLSEYAIARSLPVLGAENVDRGLLYLVNANIHTALKQYPEAHAACSQAEQIHRNFQGPHTFDLASTYYYIGDLYDEEGKYEAAQKQFEKALDIYENYYRQIPEEMAVTLSRIGTMKQKRGLVDLQDFWRALDLYLPGLTQSRNLQDLRLLQNWRKSYLQDVLQEMGMGFQAAYGQSREIRDLENAQMAFQRALAITDSFRYAFQAPASRRDWVKRYLPLYELAIGNAVHLHSLTQQDAYLETAIQLSERHKAWTLREALLDREAIQFGDLPEKMRLEEQGLRQELAYVGEQLQGISPSDSTLYQEFQQRAFELKQTYRSLVQRLEKDYPEYHRLKYRDSKVDLEAIFSFLPENQAIYSYFTGEKELFIFCLFQKKTNVYRTALDHQWQDSFAAWRRFLSQAPNPNDPGQRSALKSGHMLFSTLFPFVPDSVKSLLIIPDGELGYLPIESLLTRIPTDSDYRKLPYLIRKWEVGYVSSIQLWEDQLKTAIPAWELSYLGFAPDFGSEREVPNYSRSKEEHHTLAPLFYNQVEVEEAKRLFKGKACLGENARESQLRAMGSGTRILHFATHARAVESNPFQSHLHLSPEKGLSDGLLYAYEIFNLRLNSDLAVLSACETGQGKIHRAEGIFSLARAFQYAGCRALLSSLWRTDDLAGKQLIGDFFKELKAGKSKSLALQKAKIKQIEASDPLRAHPYYWSGMILIGDAQPLSEEGSFLNSWFFWLGLLLLAGLAMGTAFLFSSPRSFP